MSTVMKTAICSTLMGAIRIIRRSMIPKTLKTWGRRRGKGGRGATQALMEACPLTQGKGGSRRIERVRGRAENARRITFLVSRPKWRGSRLKIIGFATSCRITRKERSSAISVIWSRWTSSSTADKCFMIGWSLVSRSMEILVKWKILLMR
jgi:hypothetical protein